MFEISIFCVILLAISYWAVLWLMGRREDVLHGEFVEAGAEATEPARPIFPDRRHGAFSRKAGFSEKPVIAEQPAREPTSQKPVRMPPSRSTPAFRPERLASLLNSIKQDLNQLVQK